MPRRNILHVIDTLGVGGAEKLLVGAINSLPQFKHHVIYLSGLNTLESELPLDCEVIKLNFRSKWDSLRCIFQIHKYILRNKIELVHSHLVMASTLARLACPTKVEFFNSIHSILGKRCFAPGKDFNRWIERVTYKKKHNIIAVSKEVARDYDRCIGIKGDYFVLPNFVDDKFFKRDIKKMSFNGTLKLVTVGSLKPAKNYSYLIEAFKQLPNNVFLDIYGEGPLRGELQEKINEFNVNVRLLGVKTNIHELLGNYDLFIMSSFIEGHPVALLEAMASGMPTAISDIPVLREATANQSIYFDLDNPGDFVEKITAIASHEVNLDEYARINLNLAKGISDKARYISQLSAIYAAKLVNVRQSKSIFSEIRRPALNLHSS